MAGPFLNSGAFSSQSSLTHTTPQEELGVWRFEAGRILRYVKAAALIPQYEGVIIDQTVTTAALMGNQVNACIGDTGVLVGIADLATLPLLGYGWITVHGLATARVVTNRLPGLAVGSAGQTGVLGIQTTTYYLTRAVTVQTGLSAGSAVWVTCL